MESLALPFPGLSSYSLLDSGDGEKLEDLAGIILRRPDPQAIWHRRLGQDDWLSAELCFERETDRGGVWLPAGGKKEWELPIEVPGLSEAAAGTRILIRPTPFKHIGVFPEQASNWVWLEQKRLALSAAGVEKPRLLNLFAYTGVASVLAAKAGWEVTHVDSSKVSLDWASENAQLSDLPPYALRWMCEDALKFAGREVRRDNQYHAVMLDPPAYGRGPKGEKWLFESGIATLLADCSKLLNRETSSFGLCMSAYAIEFSPLAIFNLMRSLGFDQVEVGELALPEQGGFRQLPCGYCARV
jgi:23S rRNA (cytosine1962-C5)-methyltransferase